MPGNPHDNPHHNPHLAAPLRWFGARPGAAEVAVIVLHGRGQDPGAMAAEVVARLALPAVTYAAPAADGAAWYPASFLAPVADNEPRLGFALERVARVSTELVDAGVPVAQQIVLGFSQGACLACEYVYRQARGVGALLAFTGGLIGPPGTRWTAAAPRCPDLPVVLGGGRADPWVPAARMTETAEVFRGLGAAVELELVELGHEISDAQIAAGRRIIGAVQRSAGSARTATAMTP